MNFGWRHVGMFSRVGFAEYVCRECLRTFKDDAVGDVRAWIVEDLDDEVRPDAEMVWGKSVKIESQPSTTDLRTMSRRKSLSPTLHAGNSRSAGQLRVVFF